MMLLMELIHSNQLFSLRKINEFFLKKNKTINYSFVMGSFSQKIGDHFQHFPIDTWQDELKIGNKFGFDDYPDIAGAIDKF